MDSPLIVSNRLKDIITLLSSLVTLYLAYLYFYRQATVDARFGLAFLGILWIIFIFSIIWQEYRYAKKTRYAEAMLFFDSIYKDCQLGASESINTEKELHLLMQRICNALASAYGMITGTRCSTCVKFLRESESGPIRVYVNTALRDRYSEGKRSVKGDTITHWLDANSDFEDIFENFNKPNGKVFFENDLPKRSDYKNTSFQLYGYPKDIRIPILRDIVRNLTWKLPYKSTIVAAIYPSDDLPNKKLVGFLCVDSPSRNVFWERYDTNIMESIGSSLHPTLNKWCEI